MLTLWSMMFCLMALQRGCMLIGSVAVRALIVFDRIMAFKMKFEMILSIKPPVAKMASVFEVLLMRAAMMAAQLSLGMITPQAF